MSKKPWVPFGHPDHPFKYESHVMRARGKKGKAASPWRNYPPPSHSKKGRTA